jgi:hypothetical protein
LPSRGNVLAAAADLRTLRLEISFMMSLQFKL